MQLWYVHFLFLGIMDGSNGFIEKYINFVGH